MHNFCALPSAFSHSQCPAWELLLHTSSPDHPCDAPLSGWETQHRAPVWAEMSAWAKPHVGNRTTHPTQGSALPASPLPPHRLSGPPPVTTQNVLWLPNAHQTKETLSGWTFKVLYFLASILPALPSTHYCPLFKATFKNTFFGGREGRAQNPSMPPHNLQDSLSSSVQYQN